MSGPASGDRPRTALVIGRFQPPHHGHVALVQAALAHADEVIVAIGSAQASHTVSDPFTAGERIVLLEAALDAADLPRPRMIPVPDLGQYHLWVAHVSAYVPPYDLVVTGSPLTERLFADAGVPVHRMDPVERDRYQATEVRRRLFAGEDIDALVPDPVARMLSGSPYKERLEAIRAAREGDQG